MAKLTLFDSQSGPGSSDPFEIRQDEDLHDQARVVSIIIKSPSWNGADVTLEVCHDLSASPQEWQPEQITPGTDTVIEANASIGLLAVLGAAYRLTSADTGSPLTVLNATAVGPIGAA